SGRRQLRSRPGGDGGGFGPQLWATHDAGRTWTQIPTGGRRVTALEARGDRAFSVWARCTGAGAGFASHCTDFALHSSAAGSNTSAPVPAAPGSGPGGAG